ncbi:M48 family metallopeptidase [Halorubrum ezzemoulense]|uniref:Metal-dependent hydrolase n=1 Tax=Halorubrum ezzemoulense TaxID=337243 RepID=A0A256JEW7_HALEZ|nr:metal-dependent hydrolase [Halorubrum ezzemoulense]
MSQTTRKHTTTLAGEEVTYEVSRSDDATQPRIDAGIDGITVVLPASLDEDPETVLMENAGWVLEKKTKFDQYRADIPDRTFEAGERFPYLGEDHELIIEPRQKSEVVDQTIRLRQSAVDQSSVERALRNFYRREAREYLSKRLDQFAGGMELDYDGVQIRNQRTRWGSCSTNGTISLNWRLLMAPPEVIDYVVVHELAHLREPNHTDAFWSLVAEYIPGYETHEDWLEENSTRLVFSADDL